MKIFEVTQINEDAELVRALTQAAQRYITNRTNRNTSPNVNTDSPAQPSQPGSIEDPNQPAATTDAAVDTSTPNRPQRPQGADDSVQRQATAMQSWSEKYPQNTFVQGLPNTYYQAVDALSSDLNPQNVQRLEDAVENDTPNEIVQVLYRRLISNQGYPKEDLQAAVDEGTDGGFSQAEVDGATALLDYLRRLEMRINQ